MDIYQAHQTTRYSGPGMRGKRKSWCIVGLLEELEVI